MVSDDALLVQPLSEGECGAKVVIVGYFPVKEAIIAS